MKIIHTADIHIGKKLYEQPLSANHDAFFTQLSDYVSAEKPEAVLISGDVFDNCNPSVESLGAFNKGLLQVHAACPFTQIIVMSGNHDSAQRLAVNAELWESQNVHIVTVLSRDDNGFPVFDQNIITVKDADGQPSALVGVVPFAYEANFPKCEGDITQNVQSYYSGLISRMNELNQANLPVILMGHFTASGNIDLTGHSKNGSIGGEDAVDVTKFGLGYDYFALGHIHHCQPIKETDNHAWYSGSPVPVNFDESYHHSVSLVTILDRKPFVKLLPIHVPHNLVTFPQNPVPFDDALSKLMSYTKPDFIRLNVWANSLSNNAQYRVEKMVRENNLPCKVLIIDPQKTEEEKRIEQEKNQKQVDLKTFQTEYTPLEIVNRVFPTDLTSELQTILNEAITKCK